MGRLSTLWAQAKSKLHRRRRRVQKAIRRTKYNIRRRSGAALQSTVASTWSRFWAGMIAVGGPLVALSGTLKTVGGGLIALGGLGLLWVFVSNYRSGLSIDFRRSRLPEFMLTTIDVPGVGSESAYICVLATASIVSRENRPLTLRCELSLQTGDDDWHVTQQPYHLDTLPDGTEPLDQPVTVEPLDAERGHLAFVINGTWLFRQRITENDNWQQRPFNARLTLIDENSGKVRRFRAGWFVGAALPNPQDRESETD